MCRVSVPVFLSLVLALSGCSDDAATPRPLEARGTARTNGRVLSAEGREGLVSVTEDRLVFAATAETEAFEVGHVLASEPSQRAPYGFLRAVTGVEREGGNVVLTTRNAELHEILAEGQFQVAREIGTEDLAPNPEALSIDIPFSEVLWDDDEDPETTDDQLRVDAGFGLHAGYGITYQLLNPDGLFDDWDPFDSIDPRVEAMVGLNQYASLAVTIPPQLQTIDVRKTVATYILDPYTFFVGPVPVVITPVVTLDLAAHVEVGPGASRTYSVSEKIDASIGFRCTLDGCEQTGGLPSADTDAVLPEISDWDEAVIEVRAIPKLSLLVYGAAGVFGAIEVGGRLDVKPVNDPVWQVSLLVACEVGVSAFGHNYGIRPGFCEHSWPLLASQGEDPTVEIQVRSPSGWFVAGESQTIDVETFDPETGPIGYTLTDSAGDFGPVSLEADASFSFALSVGEHVLTATVTDPTGRTATATRTVTIVDPPPTVAIHSPTAGEKLYVGYGALLSATVVDGFGQGGALPCESVVWTSSNPSDELPADTCGAADGIWITFATAGARTLTLTANDGTNEVSKEVNVVVLPPVPGMVQVQVLSPKDDGSGTHLANSDEARLRFVATGTETGVYYYWGVQDGGETLALAQGTFSVTLSGAEVDETVRLQDLLGPVSGTQELVPLELWVDGELRHSVTLRREAIR